MVSLVEYRNGPWGVHGRRWRVVVTVIVATALLGMSCKKKEQAGDTGPTATATGVTVTGGTPAVGANSQLTATASYSDGASRNVTSSATWRTSNAGVANVGSTGIVTGVAPGVVDISAAVESVSGTLRFTVPTPTPPTPISIALSGRVTDGVSGGALANADVSVVSGVNNGRSARTDSSGRYTLAGLTTGTMTLRGNANHSAYQTLDRAVTASADLTVDLAIPRVGSNPAPNPPPGNPGSGAFVQVDTDSRTCGCSSGTITVTANGSQVGTTSCSPQSRTFNVAPGAFTLRACDNLGCWQDRSVTVGAGGTFGWLLTCSGTAAVGRREVFQVPPPQR